VDVRLCLRCPVRTLSAAWLDKKSLHFFAISRSHIHGDSILKGAHYPLTLILARFQSRSMT